MPCFLSVPFSNHFGPPVCSPPWLTEAGCIRTTPSPRWILLPGSLASGRLRASGTCYGSKLRIALARLTTGKSAAELAARFQCRDVFRIADMLAPIRHRERLGGSVNCLPNRRRPSSLIGTAGLPRIARFEDPSVFTLVPACLFTLPPRVTSRNQRASVTLDTSVNRPSCYQSKRPVLNWLCTLNGRVPLHDALPIWAVRR